MKHVFILLSAAAFLGACNTGQSEANSEERKIEYASFIDNPTEISFEEMNYDFGTVKDGEIVKHTFKFKNTGDKTLVLINVTGSCGCTVPEEWPEYPIEPGGTGEIKVEFNSSGRVGQVRKNVRVEANTNPTMSILTITGQVTE
ncbi:MAG: DUF1573 domain-containing protein [Bacteroidetes bacterium]|nr:DUF1573 domain-containing protein [Bacteroidota bacterium]